MCSRTNSSYDDPRVTWWKFVSTELIYSVLGALWIAPDISLLMRLRSSVNGFARATAAPQRLSAIRLWIDSSWDIKLQLLWVERPNSKKQKLPSNLGEQLPLLSPHYQDSEQPTIFHNTQACRGRCRSCVKCMKETSKINRFCSVLRLSCKPDFKERNSYGPETLPRRLQ